MARKKKAAPRAPTSKAAKAVAKKTQAPRPRVPREKTAASAARLTPDGKPFQSALVAELASVGADMPELRAIARKAIDQALGGEKEARGFIADRLDGKTTASAAQSGEGPVTVVIRRFAKD